MFRELYINIAKRRTQALAWVPCQRIIAHGIHKLIQEVNTVPKKGNKKDIPLLNTTISEMPVNDVPIDYLTKGRLDPLAKQDKKQPGRKSK